jgi:hypothetical protein
MDVLVCCGAGAAGAGAVLVTAAVVAVGDVGELLVVAVDVAAAGELAGEAVVVLLFVITLFTTGSETVAT